MTQAEIFNVVYGLSRMIFNDLSICAAEQRTSTYDADQMDAIIKDSKNRAIALRKLREEYENLMAQVII